MNSGSPLRRGFLLSPRHCAGAAGFVASSEQAVQFPLVAVGFVLPPPQPQSSSLLLNAVFTFLDSLREGFGRFVNLVRAASPTCGRRQARGTSARWLGLEAKPKMARFERGRQSKPF